MAITKAKKESIVKELVDDLSAASAIYVRASYRGAEHYMSNPYTVGFRVALRLP